MPLGEAESFTSDQVTSAIKSCRSIRAYGPDSLSIFHKNLGPLATDHLTSLYNDSLKTCRLISHPDSQARPRTYRKASPTDPFRCCAQLPRSSRRSSYPLSTNFSHQLKINTASDPDTLLYLPSFSSQQISRQALTSGNHLTVQCVWP